MTSTQARRIIWQTKKNIGALLTSLRFADSGAQTDARSQLSANQAQLQELWKKYPEFAPVKVRQMRLDL